MRIAVVAVLCGLIAGCATTTPTPFAATVDVTGTWRGSFHNPSGIVSVGDLTLVLQQTGTKLTGAQSPGGDLEGVVEGDTVTYRLTSGRGGDLIVNGDKMTGHSRAGSRLLFKRVQ